MKSDTYSWCLECTVVFLRWYIGKKEKRENGYVECYECFGWLRIPGKFSKNMRKLKIIAEVRADNTSQGESSNQRDLFKIRSKQHAFPHLYAFQLANFGSKMWISGYFPVFGLFRKRIVFVLFDLSQNQPLFKILIRSIDEYFASGTFVGFHFNQFLTFDSSKIFHLWSHDFQCG